MMTGEMARTDARAIQTLSSAMLKTGGAFPWQASFLLAVFMNRRDRIRTALNQRINQRAVFQNAEPVAAGSGNRWMRRAEYSRCMYCGTLSKVGEANCPC